MGREGATAAGVDARGVASGPASPGTVTSQAGTCFELTRTHWHAVGRHADTRLALAPPSPVSLFRASTSEADAPSAQAAPS